LFIGKCHVQLVDRSGDQCQAKSSELQIFNCGLVLTNWSYGGGRTGGTSHFHVRFPAGAQNPWAFSGITTLNAL